MGDSVKGLPKVQRDTTCCSPLVYQASPFLAEGYCVGVYVFRWVVSL